MTININHEDDGSFSLYIDDKYYGNYDTPVQAAQFVEELAYGGNIVCEQKSDIIQ